MRKHTKRQCLVCGMTVALPRIHEIDEALRCHCPKCDSELFAQSNGSCLTEDIAHQGETVVEALAKLEALLSEAYLSYYQSLRLIVGGGLIREEVLGQLHYLLTQGRILSFREEPGNRGALLVALREAPDY